MSTTVSSFGMIGSSDLIRAYAESYATFGVRPWRSAAVKSANT